MAQAEAQVTRIERAIDVTLRSGGIIEIMPNADEWDEDTCNEIAAEPTLSASEVWGWGPYTHLVQWTNQYGELQRALAVVEMPERYEIVGPNALRSPSDGELHVDLDTCEWTNDGFGEENTFDSLDEAEEARAFFISEGAAPEHVRIRKVGTRLPL